MISRKLIFKKILQIGYHLLFWVVVLLFYTNFFGYKSSSFSYVLYFSSFLMPVTIITTYVVIYELIPKYLLLKKYGLLILYSIYTLILSSFFIILSIFFGLLFQSVHRSNDSTPINKSILVVIVAVYAIVVLATAFKLLKYNNKSNTDNQELKNKILEAQLKLKEQELKYLKMQIHPHFLFNTLNTIYGFALKKSEETPEMILKLSNLLDYLLYQVDKPFVTLKEEVNHIEDYITLEKMRFSDTLDVSFDFGTIDSKMHIAPMLLIPFVENSFKHGQIRNQKLSIYMKLKCVDKRIYFNIKNSIHNDIKNNKDGIGLSNIKKRLSLLYEGKHTFNISKTEIFHSVELQIDTSKTQIV